LESIVRGHGDGNDLGLVAHLSSNEHHGEEHVLRHTAAAESLELFTFNFEGHVPFFVMVVVTMLIGLGVLHSFETVKVGRVRHGSLFSDVVGSVVNGIVVSAIVAAAVAIALVARAIAS